MLNKRIPIIADEYVQMDFGSGALKITPAHDVNDYAIGKRHNLPIINIMNKDASLNELAGPYAGLDRYAAREQLWADMGAAGLTIKVEAHMQRVPRSERSGEVIEPLVSSQWFVKMDGMAKKGCDAVRDGSIQIIPQRFEKVYFNWLENIQDWCISRQLWWGHRIPVWYADGHPNKFYVARTEAEALETARAELGAAVTLTQDEDVLDTWFSSGLWPFATVGWPAKDAASLAEFERFYPSSVMETGYDILFFWVARMVMLGIEFTGKPPFHTIYMHGLVRDGNGQKMSKTKGNVIDPIDTLDEYGTDALRLSLVTGCTPGQDIPLSMEKVMANRNFANKLWNTARFIVMGLQPLPESERASLAVTEPMSAAELATLPLPERWVLSRCHVLVGSVTEQLEAYDFGPAGQAIYSFLWDEYADWYRVEPAKKIGATVQVAEGPLATALVAEADALAFLARVDPALLNWELTKPPKPNGAVPGASELQALLPLADLVDADKERQRLGKQKSTLEASIATVSKRLNSPGFKDKAKPEILKKAQVGLIATDCD
ncbi:valyl-tRNA synthetase [Chrysochromulina tobinii]|uniref:valine--tRNA ligase n=1 Tax=Chrysochromulina tobinii TaxID=1460289 RepID=A0A0M0JNM7_9EUKA|nr:valyl-tRNA synthetase [Chrysochromulina tobinii]|eukprot:KOO27863.1 valyl-tRNA synthetase [Chrysochromulina sp. CCMP291]